jgi:hypothetical protein
MDFVVVEGRRVTEEIVEEERSRLGWGSRGEE